MFSKKGGLHMRRIFLVGIFVVLFLAGCSETGTCMFCGKEDVEIRPVSYQGTGADVCQDCYELYELAISALES